MHLLRARFANDIVVEFLPPHKDVGKVMIFCPGMPSVPKHKELLIMFAKKNYWAISMRYRGSWESDGEFLAKSPHLDVLDVINELNKPVISLWDGMEYIINAKEIVVLGSSFGGPAALLVSRDERVSKAIGFSPVVDWQVDSPDEPMDWLEGFVREAFGHAYRFDSLNWQKLANGEFYNPVSNQHEIDGSKVLLFHALDDMSVPYDPTKRFADVTKSKLITLKKGGHVSAGVLDKYFMRRQVWKFLDK